MDATIYSIEGKKTGTVTLPENVFGLSWNADLVKQVADSLLSNKRKAIAHTKTRAEVRGGGKKPWKQKGTGRARHGSIRSPIWVGGGVTGGPRNDKNFSRKVSKKTRVQALRTILSQKFRDGEVLFLDTLKFSEPKTKEAVKVLNAISTIKGFEHILTKRNNSLVVATSSKNKEIERALGNLGNTEVMEARNLDPISLLTYKYLMIENPKVALDVLPRHRVSAKAKAAVKHAKS